MLRVLMWPIRKAGHGVLAQTKSEMGGITLSTLLSMFILILIFLLVTWQVAFLAIWSNRLVTCATHLPSPPGDAPTLPSYTRSPSPRPRRRTRLLLLTLPLAAHGASTSSMHAVVSPAGGDHNVLSVAPYLVHVDLDALFPPDRYATFLPFVD